MGKDKDLFSLEYLVHKFLRGCGLELVLKA